MNTYMDIYLDIIDGHSRVVLEEKDGDESSDYINASYIDVSKISLFMFNQAMHIFPNGGHTPLDLVPAAGCSINAVAILPFCFTCRRSKQLDHKTLFVSIVTKL